MDMQARTHQLFSVHKSKNASCDFKDDEDRHNNGILHVCVYALEYTLYILNSTIYRTHRYHK